MPVKPNQSYTTRAQGEVMMSVRQDTAASEASAANKYTPVITDASGRIWAAAVVTGGLIAQDAAVTTVNPNIIGVQAKSDQVTDVDNDDAVRVMGDLQGRVVVTSAPRELITVQQTDIAVDTETVIVTAAANTFFDITTLVITNTAASATTVTIKDSSGGTTRLVVYAPAETTTTHNVGLAPLVQAVGNKDWTATCGTAVTSVHITAIALERYSAV